MAQLRIIHIGVDKELNSQVDFESDNLEESIYMFLTALGLEVIVTSDDEEGEADDDLAELEAYFDPKSSRWSDEAFDPLLQERAERLSEELENG